MRAKDEARTRDLNLGKVALYQLSYFRMVIALAAAIFPLVAIAQRAKATLTGLQKCKF
jgi:hypothetical protein